MAAPREANGRALADLAPDEAAQRFQTLWGSVYGMIQERNRLAQELVSSDDGDEYSRFFRYGRDKLIARHLDTLAGALDVWLEREDDERPGREQREAWTARVRELVEQLGVAHRLMNDPTGHDMVRKLQTHTSLTAPWPQERVAPRAPPSPPAPRPEERDEAAELARELAWREQDQHLDQLSLSISRQHQLSITMNEELELQTGLLQELDGDVESTGLRLGGASRHMDRLRASVRDHGTLRRD